MTTASLTLNIDDLNIEIRRSSRRRSLQITVDRGGELVLSAPPDVDEDQLRAFVREKQFWIYTKLAEKAQLQQPVPSKEFVNGEGFLYLGRSYRLLLVEQQAVPIKLVNGRFRLRQDLAAAGREHLVRWYSEHAKGWLWQKIQEYAPRMEVQPQGVKVQELGYRWGSCGKGGWLYFHWKVILLPPRIAEYVVVHELAHLHEPHHTPEFWRRIQRAISDYERRKVWLAENGIKVEGL